MPNKGKAMDILRRGRITIGPDEDTLRFLSSLDADKEIFEADIRVDKAHVIMLAEQSIISREEGEEILRCLDRIRDLGFSSLDQRYEDIHGAIEAKLIDILGENLGGKMHMARSRNDEVATCIRIVLRDHLLDLMSELVELRQTLLACAKKHLETLIPGFTHLQHAQPTTFGHHLLAQESALERDFARAFEAFERTNMNPLGSAAFASTGFPINRMLTTKLLGFEGLLENSMDAVSTRDFLIESLSMCSNLMTNMSRMAEELVLWSTSEFGLIELDDRYSSTSSIMPQKKNPDVAELIRGKTGTVVGSLVAVLTICKALPYSYNRDLQEASPHLWKALEASRSSLRMMQGMISTMRVNEARMRELAGAGFSTATELADTIVRSTGISFRIAHRIVGNLVLEGTKTGLEEIDSVALKILGRKLSSLGLTRDMIPEALDPVSNIKKRSIIGGPAPLEVDRMILEKTKMLFRNRGELEARLDRIATAYKHLDEATKIEG